ncbi:hypothetical protein YTCETSXE_CDS0044 [Staphylococcus phage MVC_VPHSA2]|nr:hypothetical protein YTCETSXE_CDS0044 [Staphylococcus phage MVC_VPHSA2]
MRTIWQTQRIFEKPLSPCPARVSLFVEKCRTNKLK